MSKTKVSSPDTNLVTNQISDVSVRTNHARELFTQFSKLSGEAGYPVRAFDDARLPHFQKLSPEQQKQTIIEIADRTDLYIQASLEKIPLSDTRQMLWRSLRRAGWVPNSDIFDHIELTDTVEAYSQEHRQIFRNLEFFKWISYTLEDLHCSTWFDLTTRDPVFEKSLMEQANRVLSGEVKHTLDLSHLKAHLCKETRSSERRQFYIDMKCVSPLVKDGKIVGIVAVNRTEAA